jgi:hypothetical protein
VTESVHQSQPLIRTGWVALVEISTPTLRTQTAGIAALIQSCVNVVFVCRLSRPNRPVTDSPTELYGTTDAIRSIRWLGSQDRYVVYCSTPTQLTSFQVFSLVPWLHFPVSHCTLSFPKPKTGAIPNSTSSFSEEFRPESSARPRHPRREKLQRRTDSRLRTNYERSALLFSNTHFFQWCFQSYQ